MSLVLPDTTAKIVFLLIKKLTNLLLRNNLHLVKYTDPVSLLMNFGSCVHLCRHLPKQNTDFCHYIMFHMSLPVSSHPHKQLFFLASITMYCFCLFLDFMWINRHCIVLCLASVTQHNILETQVCCCLFFLIAKEQYFVTIASLYRLYQCMNPFTCRDLSCF